MVARKPRRRLPSMMFHCKSTKIYLDRSQKKICGYCGETIFGGRQYIHERIRKNNPDKIEFFEKNKCIECYMHDKKQRSFHGNSTVDESRQGVF